MCIIGKEEEEEGALLIPAREPGGVL